MSASRESAPWSSGGFTVQVKVRVEGVEGRRISFQVEAHHGVDVIGAGTHERLVIQPERFLAKLEQKRAPHLGLIGDRAGTGEEGSKGRGRLPSADGALGRIGKAMSRTPTMNDAGI